MAITFQTTTSEQKQIRKLNRGELGDDIPAVIDPIFNAAVQRAKRRIK